jgi:hypothetical protein
MTTSQSDLSEPTLLDDYSTCPYSSVVERVTSNDEVRGSTPLEGIHRRLIFCGVWERALE